MAYGFNFHLYIYDLLHLQQNLAYIRLVLGQ